MPSSLPPRGLRTPGLRLSNHQNEQLSQLLVPVERAIEHCRVFRDGKRLPGEYVPASALAEVAEEGGFVWLALHEPNAEQMAKVASLFDINALVVEDAVQAHQRPKVERYGDDLFLVIRSVTYADSAEVVNSREIISTGEVQILVRSNFIITIRHGSPVPGLIERLNQDLELRINNPMALAWAVADHLVESYGKIVDLLEVEVDGLEEQVFTPRATFEIDKIYMLKREILEMRHSIDPLVGALRQLTAIHKDLVPKPVRSYFRDVTDNEIIARDQVAQFDERLTSLIDAAVAKVSLQQNQDMRRLSVIVGMISVPTLIAGIYGMNFAVMPELHWFYGYPMAIIIMIASVVIIYAVCRRHNYI